MTGRGGDPTTWVGRRVLITGGSGFIGTNAVGHFVAAGSTVTEDVPADALAISRGRQRNVKGWAKRRRGPSRPAGRKES